MNIKKLLFIAGLAVGSVWASENVQVHGFISQGAFITEEVNYLSENSTDVSLQYRELGINFQSQVNDRLRVGMQLLSRDVGVYGRGNIVVDWAYGDLFIADYLNIGIGRVKNALGFYTSIQDFDFLRTWAVLPSVLYDPGLRTLNASVDGVSLHGAVDAGAGGSFDYNAIIGRIPLGTQSDIGAYLKQFTDLPFESGAANYLGTMNLIWSTPLEGLRLNAAFSYTDALEFTPLEQNIPIDALVAAGGPELNAVGVINLGTDVESWIAGIQYTHALFEITGEFIHQYRVDRQSFTIGKYPEVPAIIEQMAPGTGEMINAGLAQEQISTEEIVRLGGGYFGVSYFAHEMLHLGAYYQYAVKNWDKDDALPSNVNHDAALSIAFMPVSNLVVKLEGHLVNGTGGLSRGLNPTLDFNSIDSWKYGIAKVSYNF
jgi:hypothetical protein